MNYKFMSFNIQSCRNFMTRKFSVDQIANVIKLYNPDIVGLNEVRGEKFIPEADESWFDQLKELSLKTGYKYYYHGVALNLKSGPYGNGIISKVPFKNIEIIAIPDPIIKDEDAFYETRCIIKASFDNFTLFITHVGLAKSEQENALNVINNLINKETKPLLLMGDFNMTPDNDLIVDLSKKLVDTSIYFKQPSMSFPSVKPRIKIDYIFTSNNILVNEAYIPKIVASDHYPYYINVNIK